MNNSNTDIIFENKSVCSAKLFDYFYGKCKIEDILRCFGMTNDEKNPRCRQMTAIISKGTKRFQKGLDVCREEMVDELRYIMKYH